MADIVPSSFKSKKKKGDTFKHIFVFLWFNLFTKESYAVLYSLESVVLNKSSGLHFQPLMSTFTSITEKETGFLKFFLDPAVTLPIRACFISFKGAKAGTKIMTTAFIVDYK